LIYWPKVRIPRPVWDDLNPEVKEKLQTKRIWNEYWTAYSRSSVGFFPGYAESWKAHYGLVSYQLLKGLKKLFDPKNILNPQKIPEEG
jgi:FAD/FMN-containing dehydrogenase